jgi:ABC-2 type transport system ATP-binding protein
VTAPYALATERLGRRYGSVWGLRDCSLALPAGRVIALVGPNGAGKTTLLRLVAGLLQPTEGAIEVAGEPLDPGTAAGLARVGFVAQDFPLYKRFRVRDLLRMGQAMNPRWDRALAERRLGVLDIPLGRRADALSGGQQAQVALALALAKHPELLLLDEPVARLDPLARREFMQTLLSAVAEEGHTVLLSSHLVGDLERVCDYLILLRHGRLEVAEDIDDLLAAHRMMVGPRCDRLGGLGDDLPGLVHVDHGDRHSNAVVRTNGAPVAPGWDAHPLDLEELVLAYLQRPSTAEAGR